MYKTKVLIQSGVFWVVFLNVCGWQCYGVGLSRRTHAHPGMYDISVADTPCCQQCADNVVSGSRQRQRLCQRGTPGHGHLVGAPTRCPCPGTFRNEQSASWCTVSVGYAGVPTTSATDAGSSPSPGPRPLFLWMWFYDGPGQTPAARQIWSRWLHPLRKYKEICL